MFAWPYPLLNLLVHTDDFLIVGAPPPLDLGGGGGGYDRPYRGSPRVTFDDS